MYVTLTKTTRCRLGSCCLPNMNRGRYSDHLELVGQLGGSVGAGRDANSTRLIFCCRIPAGFLVVSEQPISRRSRATKHESSNGPSPAIATDAPQSQLPRFQQLARASLRDRCGLSCWSRAGEWHGGHDGTVADQMAW